MTVREARRRYAHGTNARYHLGRCRCEKCLRAHRRYAAQLAADPSRRLVPIDDVVRHIRFLQSQGMGVQTIARAAGMMPSVLSRFVSRYRPISRTRRATAAKILAVRPTSVKTGMHVKVGPTLVLIERLVAAGYKKGWIARQIGQTQAALMIGRSSSWVTIRKAKAIHRLYRSVSRTDARVVPISAKFSLGEVEPVSRRSVHWRAGDLRQGEDRLSELHTHGTIARAQILGCRCLQCKKAQRELDAARLSSARRKGRFQVRRAGARTWNVLDRANDSALALCARSKGEAMRARDALNLADPICGAGVLVDSQMAQEHVRALIAAGVGRTAIAQAASVTPGYLSWLLRGRKVKTQRAVEQRILAVDATASSSTERVAIAPVYILVDRLILAGLNPEWLGSLLGFPIKHLLRRRGQGTTSLWRAQAIMRLYHELRMRVALVRNLERTAAGVAA